MKNKLKSYSQVGQDRFVLSMFPKNHKGFFIDIGCQLPNGINNTLLLEENGWDGISFDIVNYSKEWEKERKTKFVCADALSCDFSKYKLPKVIDYLSLDIEGDGSRVAALKRILNCGFVFKIITIEHDSYRGYEKTERDPQRELLTQAGYHLFLPDVSDHGLAFEDWWIHPEYIK